MYLCKEQERIVTYKGRSVEIPTKAANAHYYICNMPVNDTGVGMYIGYALHGDERIERINQLTDEELVRIVYDGVKEEFLSLLPLEVWDSIPE